MPLYPQGGGLYPNSIDNVLLNDMADGTVKGRPTGAGLGDPQDIAISSLLAASGITAFGQCQVDFVSSSVLRLNRFNGYLLTIDNTPRVIPSAGVDLAPTGLTAATLYYIYAYMSGAVMTLEAATAVPVLDSRNGMKVKTGDASRTLVGMGYPLSGPVWQAVADGSRYVSSWFNRRQFRCNVGVSMSTGTASAWINTGGAGAMLVWANDMAEFFSEVYYLNSAACSAYSGVTVDSAATPAYFALGSFPASYYGNVGNSAPHPFPTDGLHTFNGMGYQTVGGGAWTGSVLAVFWA